MMKAKEFLPTKHELSQSSGCKSLAADVNGCLKKGREHSNLGQKGAWVFKVHGKSPGVEMARRSPGN